MNAHSLASPSLTPVGVDGARPSGRAIPCFDPGTGADLGEVRAHSPDDVRAAVARARRAQAAWAETSFAERRRVLRRLLELLLRDADELCAAVVRDAGKTREHAVMGEIWPVAEKLRATMKNGERYLRAESVGSGLLVHKRARIHFEPLGVIGVICPWNYPLQNVFGPTIPALMAGNAVVAKVSEWTSWSAAPIQALFDEALTATGHSPDLVQVVSGFADTGEALVRSGADKIVFTGSVPNGKRVLAASADSLTPVILELGGKDALIVCDDAHLEQAAQAAMSGTFITAGQSCLAAERILVFPEIYDAFEKRMVELVRGLRQGAPSAKGDVDVGAITTPAQLEVIGRLVDDAVRRGAKVLAGGERRVIGDPKACFYAPTLLADVTPDMPIMQEEVFGPVMLLVRVQDEADAVRVTNGTQFGLGCTVMTKSRARATRLARAVRVGNVSVNEFGLTYMAQELPFGGVGASGFGRLNGKDGMRAMCNTKSVLDDRLPLHFPTALFPVRRGQYELTRDVIRVLYSPGITPRLAALGELAQDVRRLFTGPKAD